MHASSVCHDVAHNHTAMAAASAGRRFIAYDIEKTGQHGEIISVGVACVDVDPTGVVVHRETHQISFGVPAMPCDAVGPIIERVVSGPGPLDFTGLFRKDHGAIVTWGAFEKRCFTEFWSNHIPTLIKNIDWSPGCQSQFDILQQDVPPGITDAARGAACVYMLTHRLASEGADKNHDVRIITDNAQYDIGSINAALTKLIRHHVVKDGDVDWDPAKEGAWCELPSITLDYLPIGERPDVGAPRSSMYRSVRDIRQFVAGMPREEWYDPPDVEHDHLAKNDALVIALRYAHYYQAAPHKE